MKKTVIRVLILLVVAGLCTGGGFLWQMRPWRVVVSVNGHALTAKELDQRAQTMLNDYKTPRGLMVPESESKELIQQLGFDRRAAKAWIMREILLSEAIARGIEVTPEDEAQSKIDTERKLKSRGKTLEEFFKDGPIPEDVKRREFREVVLINKFLKQEVTDKIKVETAEIDARLAALQQAYLAAAKKAKESNQKTKVLPPTRKQVIDLLRMERYNQGVRALTRELYKKATVKCPLFPDLETLNNFSGVRPEDSTPSATPATQKPATATVPAAKPAKPAPAQKPAAATVPAAKTVKPVKK